MTHTAIDIYLNDHLAGAMFGSDLARQIRDQNENTPLGQIMSSLAPQIEEDRQTLLGLMADLGTTPNPVKRAGAWVAEKAARVKFTGLSSGQPELGTFLALESLSLGVQGKLALWKTLRHVAGKHPAVASINLEKLIHRAQTQYELLEHERLTAGARALSHIHTQHSVGARAEK